MYSYEERKKAVDLYIKYGKKATAVITELGYPNRHSLVQWYKAFIKAGKIEVPDLSGRTKYTEEQKIKAVKFYIEHGNVAAGDKLPENAGEKFPLLGI